jgi:hypothetical protein
MIRVMSFLPLNELPALFPHVVDWISYLEKQARDSGRPLILIEFNLAQSVGVAHPEQVRILSVPRIPLPSHPRVKQLAKEAGLLTADTGGLKAGYGLIVRLDCTRNLRLLAHEFVHVAQYERLGREGFLQEYIQQIAAHGYADAPFELEAEAKASNACHVVRLARCKPATSKKSNRTRSSGDSGMELKRQPVTFAPADRSRV